MITHIVLVLIILGFVIWAIDAATIPMNPWIKKVIIGILCIGVLIWLLNALGFHTGIPLHL